LFIVARRERVAPRQSLRRVMIGLGLLAYVLLARQLTGSVAGALVAAQLLILTAYVHVMAAALSVEARRGTWQLRTALALLLLPVGFVSLLLL
jgi:hypothetical protein